MRTFFNLLLIVAGTGVWVSTLGAVSFGWVVAHYVSLVLAAGGLALLFSNRFLDRGAWVPLLGCLFVLAVVGTWARFDTYTRKWIGKDGTEYHDRVRRFSGEIRYRTLFTPANPPDVAAGPIRGGKPHGKWTYRLGSLDEEEGEVITKWYWGGREVSAEKYSELSSRSR